MTVTNVAAGAGQLVVLFVASDGPGTKPQSVAGVSGGGLTWNRAVFANGQGADAEIWWARPATAVSGVTVTVTRTLSGCNTGVCNGLVGVVVLDRVNAARPIGATGSNSGLGAPRVSLTTTHDRSWVVGVAADWTHAELRVIGPGQTMAHDDQSTENDDEYWIQYLTDPVPTSGTTVELSDLAPTDHRFDFAAAEIVPA